MRRLTAVGLLLLLASPLHAQETSSTRVATLVLVGGSSADLGSTLYDLHTIPGAQEGNAVLAHGGTAGLVGLKVGLTTAIVLGMNRITKQGHPRIAAVLGWTGGLFFGAMAARNLQVGR